MTLKRSGVFMEILDRTETKSSKSNYIPGMFLDIKLYILSCTYESALSSKVYWILTETLQH